MTRLVAAAAAALALCGSAILAQPPVDRSDQVVFDIAAVDGRGAPVMDLRPADLEVWIGHFQVPIQSLTVVTPESDEGGGRLIVLLLDNVTVAPTLIPRVHEVADEFVSRMTPGDRMSVVMLDGGEMETTDEPARLRAAIDRYNVGGGYMDRDLLGQHVLKTIASLARQIMEAAGQRKTIVGIGNGWVFDRPIPTPIASGRDLRPEWVDAMRTMAYAKANLYVIDPAGVGTAGAYTGDTGFARETGGFAFVNTNNFKGAVDRIRAEASNYYIVAVSNPPTGHTADLRELEVKVHRRGVIVRARHAVPGS